MVLDAVQYKEPQHLINELFEAITNTPNTHQIYLQQQQTQIQGNTIGHDMLFKTNISIMYSNNATGTV